MMRDTTFSILLRAENHPEKYGRPLLDDPTFLEKGIDVKKKAALYDIHLQTDEMRLTGFHKLDMDYLRVIRHSGLREHYGVNRGKSFNL